MSIDKQKIAAYFLFMFLSRYVIKQRVSGSGCGIGP